MSEGQVECLLVQAAQGARLVGGLYAGAGVLCELNTFDDMRTVVMASSAETPSLLLGAVFLGYGLRTYGPPLIAVPSAAVGGAIIIGALWLRRGNMPVGSWASTITPPIRRGSTPPR